MRLGEDRIREGGGEEEEEGVGERRTMEASVKTGG